jgi:acetoin utilization deacetylase AcuC-like enzyme
MPETIPMRIITDSRCADYAYPGHPERPARVTRSVQLLRRQSSLPIVWDEPLPVEREILLRAHTAEHLDRLENQLDFDMDTPTYPDIAGHARRSVGGALRALKSARAREHSFALLRPPGHHATRDRAMGFCYLGNVAIAALEARAAGVDKVAVFDFDVHHGNGTEAILLDQPGCAFFSIHQFPAYPGTGRRHQRNCHNYPVAPGLSRQDYREVAEQALEELRLFKPELIAVSAGFDAYSGDPLCQQLLEHEDFHWFGRVLRELAVPMFSVLEGGYSDQLPDLVLAYLQGIAGLPLDVAASGPAIEEEPAASAGDRGLEPPWGQAF